METKEEAFEYMDEMLEIFGVDYVDLLWTMHYKMMDSVSMGLTEIGQEEGLGSDDFQLQSELHGKLHTLKSKYFSEFIEPVVDSK